jgi:hypothetical protein
VYHLNEEGPEDGDTSGGGGEGEAEGPVVAQYTHWGLPAAEFEGTWESLLYEDEDGEEEGGGGGGGGGGVQSKRARVATGAPAPPPTAADALSGSHLKPALLQYAASAMLFSDKGVSGSLIAWNHVILLHGPPGTGKTSLCKALAHKLAIRLGDRFPTAQLIEINAHSLFSRWFSESGKLVHKLFSHIREIVDDEECLVVLLIDEVRPFSYPPPPPPLPSPSPPSPPPPQHRAGGVAHRGSQGGRVRLGAFGRGARCERGAHGNRLLPRAEERAACDNEQRERGD